MSGSSGTERKERRVRWGMAALVLILAGVGSYAWSLVRSGDPFAPGTRVFNGNAIELSFPAGWNVHDQGWPTTGFGSTFAILGTQPWGLCLPFDLNCHYQLRLEPSQISVALEIWQMFGEDLCAVGADRSDLAGRGPGDPPAQGRLMRVDGRPTLQTDYAVNQTDYYHADEWRSWVIAAPGSTVTTYTIFAQYRGPGVPRFREQLDDMVASVRFVGSAPGLVPGQLDCGAPFP